MTLEQFLKLTRQQLGLIILGLLIGLLGAGVLLHVTPVNYRATAVAYVRVSVPDASQTADGAGSYYTASQLATQKAKAFVSVFTSEAVAEDVISSLGLDETPTELAHRITTNNETNSLIITVSATDGDAAMAQKIADQTVVESEKQVKELEGDNSPVEVVLMSSSALSAVAKSPSTPKYLMAGALLGVVLGYGLALARHMLDKRIRTSSDVQAVLEEPVVGVLPTSVTMTKSDAGDPDYRMEEALRKLRTNLRYANVDSGLKKLVVSSSVQGEGKSNISANLARVMALAGEEVVLIDGDLRRPVHAERFGISKRRPGLSQLLVGATTLEEALVKTDTPGLSVIPAGDTPPNPSELLGSSRLHQLVDFLAESYVVIIDAPPVLPVTDAVALSARVDGVLLVARAGKTTTDQLMATKSMLTRGGGTIVGVVLNQVSTSGLGRLRYGDTEYAYSAYHYEYKADHAPSTDVEATRPAPAPAPPAEEPSPAKPRPTSHAKVED